MPVRLPSQSLVRLLSSRDAAIRTAAAWEIAYVDKDRAAALPALCEMASNADRRVRYAAAWGLRSDTCQAPADQTGVLNAADALTRAPRALTQPKPVYPREAFFAGIEGTVVLRLLIGEEGEVAYAEVEKSVPGLDLAALECVHDWRFEPAQAGGRPYAVVAQAPVTFKIFANPKPSPRRR